MSLLETLLLHAFLLLAVAFVPGLGQTRGKACWVNELTVMSRTCVCNNYQEPDVRCVGLELRYIPVDIYPKTVTLTIIQNEIARIEKDDFKGQENIKTLFLQQNKISWVDPNAFRNMFRLELLNLEENRLAQLDPSGLIFQHLPGLSRIALQQNSIERLNKYSFLTLNTESNQVEVKLDKNSIVCDCDVLALRRWQLASTSPNPVILSDLRCVNDQLNRFYTDVPETLFGQCSNSTQIYAGGVQCHRCTNLHTNYACQQTKKETCLTDQMMCQRTIEWDDRDKQMLISSQCIPKNRCLNNEKSNMKACGIGYQKNKDVTCNLCCLGPICQNNTIGGRTVDYTYILAYIRAEVPYQPYMRDESSQMYINEQKRIADGLTSDWLGVEAGVDIYILRYEPHGDQEHKVVLRVEVTAFNTYSQAFMESSLRNQINSSLSYPRSFLNSEGIYRSSIYFNVSYTGSEQCQRSSTTSDKGTFTWHVTNGGTDTNVLCPYQDSFTTGQAYANRICVFNAQGIAVWLPPSESSCALANQPVDIDKLNSTSVTKDNAVSWSAELLQYTDNVDDFTPEVVNNIVNLLEQLLADEIISSASVVRNMANTVSTTLQNTEDKTLRTSEERTSTSKRLLKIINKMPEKVPLNNGPFKVTTPNLAIAAQSLSRGETRDLKFSVSPEPGKAMDYKGVNLNYLDDSDENPISPNGASMTIPTKSLIQSLSSREKNSLERMAFTVHASDKLFKSMQKPNGSIPEDLEEDIVIAMINSQVISARVPDIPIHDLNENITMTFEHDADNSTNPRCVFWGDAAGEDKWLNEGCGVVQTYDSHTICGCNHLTNFALLMDVYQQGSSLSELDRKILSVISYVGCGISLLALALTLLTYLLFRKLRRDNPSKILVNLCVALILSNLVFLVGMQDYAFDNSISCKLVAVLLHYFLLASLTWMAVEAFYMYLALVLVFKTYFTRFILKCALVGWGVPLVIVAVTLGINSTDNYGFVNSGLCWLKNPAFYAAFVGPVCIILLMNCAAFCLVVRQLLNMSSAKLNKTDRNSTWQKLRGAVGVVILLGLSWLFAIFAIDQASVAFYYLFAVFNSLQGLFIFIFYCLLKKDAMTAWKRVLPCCEEYGETSKTSSNSRDAAKKGKKTAAATAVATAMHAVRSKKGPSDTSVTGNTSSSNISDSAKYSPASPDMTYEKGDQYSTIKDVDADITTTNAYNNQGNFTPRPAPGNPSGVMTYSETDGHHVYNNVSPKPQLPQPQRKPEFKPHPQENQTAGSSKEPIFSNYSLAKSEVVVVAKPKVVLAAAKPKLDSQPIQQSAPQFISSDYSASRDSNPQSPGEQTAGEIDITNTAKVSDIRLKFDRKQ